MPPKRLYRRPLRRGAKAKEEAERQLREALERQKEEIRRKEQEAEDKQKLENELRDVLDQKEKKLQRKEARSAIVSLKEKTIQELTVQLDSSRINYNAVKADLESEIGAVLHLKETIESEYTAYRSEAETTIARLERERDDLAKRLQQEIGARERTVQHLQNDAAAHTEKQAKLNNDLTNTTCEVQLLRERLEKKEAAHAEETNRLQNELKQTDANVATLREALAAREEDDKKNVMLLRLLSQKFDGAQEQHARDLAKEHDGKKDLQDGMHKLRETIVALEGELANTHKVLNDTKTDWAQQIAEYDTRLEQAKFDIKFLESELQVNKEKLDKQNKQNSQLKHDTAKASTSLQSELQSVVSKLGDKDAQLNAELRSHFDNITVLQAENRTLKIELEKAERQNDQVEEMLKKRERDHFDKATQLTSQISQQRNTITQLQQKITQERQLRLKEVSSLTTEVDQAAQDLSLTRSGQQKALVEAREHEAKMNTDVATMRTAVFEMQNAVVQKEIEIENVKVQMNKMLETLKEQLEQQEHQHEEAMQKARADWAKEAVTLRERIRLLTRDLETHHKLAMDTDVHKQAQISNLNNIVEKQMEENLELKKKMEKTEKACEEEIQRLQEHLNANFIPHKPRPPPT
eukprot:TRINITY_DN84172_c0_g1_i1.p1 TRINITY_DN84172_c0_g1~~TRINITY_DN84172_c0_g1_i1.p1  ORF type:complete len:636 (+),score=100.64 TRINITY_DN84172_c0_g1_i1:31-1938(+)